MPRGVVQLLWRGDKCKCDGGVLSNYSNYFERKQDKIRSVIREKIDPYHFKMSDRLHVCFAKQDEANWN